MPLTVHLKRCISQHDNPSSIDACNPRLLCCHQYFSTCRLLDFQMPACSTSMIYMVQEPRIYHVNCYLHVWFQIVRNTCNFQQGQGKVEVFQWFFIRGLVAGRQGVTLNSSFSLNKIRQLRGVMSFFNQTSLRMRSAISWPEHQIWCAKLMNNTQSMEHNMSPHLRTLSGVTSREQESRREMDNLVPLMASTSCPRLLRSKNEPKQEPSYSRASSHVHESCTTKHILCFIMPS